MAKSFRQYWRNRVIMAKKKYTFIDLFEECGWLSEGYYRNKSNS